MGKLASTRIFQPKAFAFYDVSGSVKSWGRRGIALGGVFGFTLGVAFVAIPFTSDVLTFGVIGTLIVAAVEGAVIAGAFAVGIAAFYGRGEPYNGGRCGRVVSPASLAQDWLGVNERAEPTASEPLADVFVPAPAAEQSALSARQWISTIDAWENGTSGP